MNRLTQAQFEHLATERASEGMKNALHAWLVLGQPALHAARDNGVSRPGLYAAAERLTRAADKSAAVGLTRLSLDVPSHLAVEIRTRVRAYVHMMNERALIAHQACNPMSIKPTPETMSDDQ